MKTIKKNLTILFLFLIVQQPLHSLTPPKLTVMVILDQFAYHYLIKLRKNFQYGFREMLDNGIVYENAYHPHGIPETSPGHNAFNTGVLPKDHGVVGNKWFTPNGTSVRYGSGKEHESSYQTKVEGFSDHFVLSSNKQQKRTVFSLGLKSRSTISTANKLGKAIWFDEQNAQFSTNKDYFKQSPSWLTRFNRKHDVSKLTSIGWETLYNRNSQEYQYPFIDDYSAAVYPFKMANNNNISLVKKGKKKFKYFLQTPESSKHLFSLAETFLSNNLAKKSSDQTVLWLCVSNLDLLGHMYGPDSLEAIDMLYHLDKQLLKFIKFTQRRYKKHNVMFVLSGDHGIQPIQEVMVKKGIKSAKRINAKKLIKKMNALIEEKFDIKDIVANFATTYFVLNHKTFDELEKQDQSEILDELRNFLNKIPGIKKTWTRSELEKKQYVFGSLESFYKNHLSHKNAMDLICMPDPYCLLTNYPTGASHSTPYEYDTHVPLIFYAKGLLKPKTIRKKVWIPQVPITLSRLHGISKPSASTFHELPGIFS